MAAVPIGFERWDPGHPWGDVIYDDGSRTSVPDPDGSIEAEASAMGARFNAMPKAAPTPVPQPSVTGAASPPLQPSTPSPDVPAPAPTADRGPPPPAQPSAQPLGQSAAPTPRQPLPLGPAPFGANPSTAQSPAARAVADQGIDPNSLRPGGAQGGSPAARAVLAHAPNLMATTGEVSSEAPDQQTQSGVRAASDAALSLRGQSINENLQAQAQNLNDQARQANVDYLRAWPKQLMAQADEAAAQKARDNAAAQLAKVRATPLDNHPDFPEWMVVTSLLGGIAGGFNQGFTGGAYKSTTPGVLHQLVSEWADNQRFNKSQLLQGLEEQLGDKNAALAAAKAGLHEAIANVADSQARYARTVQSARELSAAAKASRATALDEWGKTQTIVAGKESEKATMAFGLNNEITQALAQQGVSPQMYDAGLSKKIVGGGDNALTLNQAIDLGLQLDSDIDTLNSLAAANQGTLPGKGLIKIPEALVGPLAKLGIRQGMQAEQVRQIYQEYLVKNAKQMGSRINPQELEISGETLGATTAAFMRQLARLQTENDRAISSTAEQAWPGAGQQVLDIHRRGTAAVRGIAHIHAIPFEATNAPEAPPVDKPPMENPELHITSEEQQRLDAENAAIKLEEEKGRREREAEVKRRRERPIPGAKF